MRQRLGQGCPQRVAVALGALLLLGCGGGLAEISAYPIKCAGFGPAACKPLNPITFGVSAEHQFVLEWIPGVSDVPVRHSGCVVRNAKNWTCYDAASVTRREMVRGHFSESAALPAGDGTIFFLTRTQAWMRTLGFAKYEKDPQG